MRVYADHRIAYYPSGQPGVGQRVFERTATAEAASVRAAQLRLAIGARRVDRATLTPVDLMQLYLDDRRAAGGNKGTIRQYKSDFNCGVPDAVATTRVVSLTRVHWTQTFEARSRGGSANSVTALARTINALIRWADDHEYFGAGEAFATSRERRASIVKAAKAASTKRLDGQTWWEDDGVTGITLDMCPSLDDVLALAEAVEVHYPGYGRRLVLLDFGSRLRLCELLALRTEHLVLETGLIRVQRQLNRYKHWPAVGPPKGGYAREALLLSAFGDVAASLIADANTPGRNDPGWLFPRHRSWSVGRTRQASSSAQGSRMPPGTGPFTAFGTATPLGSLRPNPSAGTAKRRRPSRSGSGTRSCRRLSTRTSSRPRVRTLVRW